MGAGEVTEARAALRAAEALYAEGKLPESEAAFGALLRTEVRAEALYGMGRISFGTGDLGRAQALFEQALGVERRSPDALYYLGRTLLARGSTLNAIACFAEALAYQPDHDLALRELVSLASDTTAPVDLERAAAPQPDGAPPVPVETSGWPGDTAITRATAPEAAGPPRQPQDTDSLVGVVTQLSKGVGPWRGRPAAAQIWTFRLEVRGDGSGGEPAGIVAVELRGHEITGTLEDGDWVEIGKRSKTDAGWRPKELRNLSANDLVKARWRWFTN